MYLKNKILTQKNIFYAITYVHSLTFSEYLNGGYNFSDSNKPGFSEFSLGG